MDRQKCAEALTEIVLWAMDSRRSSAEIGDLVWWYLAARGCGLAIREMEAGQATTNRFDPDTAPKETVIEIWDAASGHRIWRPVVWSDMDGCWLCAVTYAPLRPVVLKRCTHWREVVPPPDNCPHSSGGDGA